MGGANFFKTRAEPDFPAMIFPLSAAHGRVDPYR